MQVVVRQFRRAQHRAIDDALIQSLIGLAHWQTYALGAEMLGKADKSGTARTQALAIQLLDGGDFHIFTQQVVKRCNPTTGIDLVLGFELFQTLGAVVEGVFQHRSGEGQRLFAVGIFGQIDQQVQLVQVQVGAVFCRIIGCQDKAYIGQTIAHAGAGFRQAKQGHGKACDIDVATRALCDRCGILIDRDTDGRCVRIAICKVQALCR